jgi:predicted nucleic acid-binding protein
MDTVGFLALWDNTDQWHQAAVLALDAIDNPAVRTITTSFILLECGNAAARRPYRLLVDQTRRKLEQGGKVIAPNSEDWEEAWAGYLRGEAADAGIVDHISFAVMRRLGIRDVFTNDRHFKAAGFNTLF